MTHFSRRTFFLGAGVTSAAVLTPTSLSPALAAERVRRPAGTTLESAAAPVTTTGYTRLTAGPGYPVVARPDALPTAPETSTADARRALASFVQFTDVHVIDAQSPMRFEYLHDITGSAFRPQEALGTQGGVALVERVNALGKGPHTERPFDCVVTTGDSTDNHETIELEWFLTLMNGGDITPSTGDPARWEGVQSGGSRNYWRPETTAGDRYKDAGFPVVPDFFARATATHTSPGLRFPWFSVFGNHDDSICGTLPSDWPAYREMYTGEYKFTGFTDPAANRQLESQVRSDVVDGAAKRSAAARITGDATPRKEHRVTADERRAPFTPVEFMKAHLAMPSPAGPRGNGFTDRNVVTGEGYYSFELAPGVVGIALDSTNRAGYTGGSLGHAQYLWLERTLKAGSSHWYDVWGARQKHSVEDTFFLVFSHHTPATMNNLVMDPHKPELRHAGWDVENLLSRFPNVLAWVNGHTHVNEIHLRRHRAPDRSYWEINTASHVDFPQQARVIEVVDNADGTLSLLTTLIESEAPYQGDSPASLYREYSYNDPHADHAAEGRAEDRNTELLLVNPQAR